MLFTAVSSSVGISTVTLPLAAFVYVLSVSFIVSVSTTVAVYLPSALVGTTPLSPLSFT